MTDGNAIDAASKRLARALDALEAAVARRQSVEGSRAELAQEIQALGADRARLASDLDAAVARARSLEDTNREIARRLDLAIGTIRSMLEDRIS
jgi:chromosome segregation ATPase